MSKDISCLLACSKNTSVCWSSWSSKAKLNFSISILLLSNRFSLEAKKRIFLRNTFDDLNLNIKSITSKDTCTSPEHYEKG